MNRPKNFEEMNGKLPIDYKIEDQIIPWKTKDFAYGYKARVNRKPFDQFESKEWQKGWWHANFILQMID